MRHGQEGNLWGCDRRWAGFGILLSQWPEEDRLINGKRLLYWKTPEWRSPGGCHRQGRWNCRCWKSIWKFCCSPSSRGSCTEKWKHQTVDQRGSAAVAEIHQCGHKRSHTCPAVPLLESWDWTAPPPSPPRSVDRSRNSSAHWVGWHKQTLSPKARSCGFSSWDKAFTSWGRVCLFGCRHSEDGERVLNVSLQVTWR